MNCEKLSTEQYRNTFFENLDHTLIDVRTAKEFARGHVPGAMNLPLDELTYRLHEIPMNRPVVLVCRTGNRSQTAQESLCDLGMSRVFNLEGGTEAWKRHRLPLE